MPRQLDNRPSKYGEQADKLNDFAIRLKKKILAGDIKDVTCKDVDNATLPAIRALLSEKYDPRKF